MTTPRMWRIKADVAPFLEKWSEKTCYAYDVDNADEAWAQVLSVYLYAYALNERRLISIEEYEDE